MAKPTISAKEPSFELPSRREGAFICGFCCGLFLSHHLNPSEREVQLKQQSQVKSNFLPSVSIPGSQSTVLFIDTMPH